MDRSHFSVIPRRARAPIRGSGRPGGRGRGGSCSRDSRSTCVNKTDRRTLLPWPRLAVCQEPTSEYSRFEQCFRPFPGAERDSCFHFIQASSAQTCANAAGAWDFHGNCFGKVCPDELDFALI